MSRTIIAPVLIVFFVLILFSIPVIGEEGDHSKIVIATVLTGEVAVTVELYRKAI